MCIRDRVISVTVDEANNAAKVELSCDYINEDVVMLEKESALITFQAVSYTHLGQTRHCSCGHTWYSH